MTADPLPPPEAQLFTERYEAMVPQPSRAELARRAGISPALWAKIEKGYDQPAPGIRTPYRGSAKAVAAMAAVTGVTARELGRCGRDDAARILSARRREPERPQAEPTVAELKASLDHLTANVDRLLRRIEGREQEDGDEPNGHNGSRRAG